MFKNLLEKIALKLEQSDIPYMVIGGQAVLVYGEPRLTRDIDITVGVLPERADAVSDIARSAGLRPLVDPEAFTSKTLVLKYDLLPLRISLFINWFPADPAMLRT